MVISRWSRERLAGETGRLARERNQGDAAASRGLPHSVERQRPVQCPAPDGSFRSGRVIAYVKYRQASVTTFCSLLCTLRVSAADATGPIDGLERSDAPRGRSTLRPTSEACPTALAAPLQTATTTGGADRNPRCGTPMVAELSSSRVMEVSPVHPVSGAVADRAAAVQHFVHAALINLSQMRCL